MKSRPWPIVNRAIAAVLGGYALTYAFIAGLARLLPIDKADAVVITNLVSFALYLIVLIWIFSRATSLRSWGVVMWSVPLAMIGFWPTLKGMLS
jgi:Ca2+/Na+ antiporter